MSSSPRNSGKSEPAETVAFDSIQQPEGVLDLDSYCLIGLEVVGGPMDGTRLSVSATCLTIGRADDNDFQLPHDETVSSHHARILREGSHFWLEDLNSTNGTYIGDLRVKERVPLGDGTLFTVGMTSLEFVSR